MTPSLVNFFWSLLWGGAVVGAIAGGVIFISQADKIKRNF